MALPQVATNSPFTLYTIGEAADILGISIPTIRMYEREGLIIPHRKSSKHRRFTQADMDRIRCVRKMINEEKISIAGIRRMLSLIPCWKIKDCPDDVRANCSAFTQHDKPCWMVSDKTWEAKSEQCRECIVYSEHAGCQSLKETIAGFTIQETSKQAAMVG